MTKQQIAKRIFNYAVKYAKGRGKSIGHDATNDLLAFADKAANEVVEALPDQQKGREKLMQIAFEHLIDEMIVAAKGIHGYPPNTIGEKTLERALLKICPLVPFC